MNGARLWVHVGTFTFQPGELAKICLIVFLAAYLREKREVLAQGRLKDVGPAARDLGRAPCSCSSRRTTSARPFSTSGSSSRCSTSRPRGSRTWSSGIGLFLAGGCRRVPEDQPRPRARHDLAAPVDDAEGVLPVDRWALAAPGLPELPAREVALLDRQRRLRRRRARQGHVHDHRRACVDPVRQHRLHLLGARAGARTGRRRGAAARLHAVRRARDEDRAPGRRRLLEAARGRASRSASRSRRSSSSAASCGSSR